MSSGHRHSRDHAARLLGVTPDAEAADVRRAFRLWASMAHPDHGGSAERFAELRAARDRLLEPMPVPSARTHDERAGVDRAGGRGSSDAGTGVPLRPRAPWSQVLVRPGGSVLAGLALGCAAAMASVLLARWMTMPWGVIPAAVASAAWCVAVSHAILRGADHGHVIVTRSLAWAAVTTAQVIIATSAGIPVVEVMPVLALPFVAVIAAVNPAAGLWRARSVNVR